MSLDSINWSKLNILEKAESAESTTLTNATATPIPAKPAGQQRSEWNGSEWVVEPYGSKRYEWNGSEWVAAPGSEFTWDAAARQWTSPAEPTESAGTFTMPDGSVVKGVWKFYPNTGWKKIPDTTQIVTPAKVNTGMITEGDGTKDSPFKFGGVPYTGTMNGIKYVNGIAQGAADDTTGTPTTSVDVLKSMLKSVGYPSKIIDSSVGFLNKLLKDGLDYNNAVQIFLNSKDYTFKDGSKMDSPFYTEYGIYNEGLNTPYDPATLFNTVEGFKEIKNKYSLSDKYITPDSIKKYLANKVTVEDLDRRANMARLKGIAADPVYTATLQKLGFIKSGADLTDFYLDENIGKEQLESNRVLAAFTTEAVRRMPSAANVPGITVDVERFKKFAADLQAQGYSEQGAAELASKTYETIAQQLPQLSMLSGVFEKGAATEAQRAVGLQPELESEQLMGLASKRRKMLEQQNINIFSGASGRAQIRPGSLAGQF